MPLQVLRQANGKQSVARCKQWELQTDGKAQGFFRSLSHRFSQVKVTVCEQNAGLFTLCFDGSATLPSTAIHFTCKGYKGQQEEVEASGSTSRRLRSEDDEEVLAQSVLKGTFVMDDEPV